MASANGSSGVAAPPAAHAARSAPATPTAAVGGVFATSPGVVVSPPLAESAQHVVSPPLTESSVQRSVAELQKVTAAAGSGIHAVQALSGASAPGGVAGDEAQGEDEFDL
eukprot:7388297-Prymnesium_polylepis.1